jgi:hypothetical protein
VSITITRPRDNTTVKSPFRVCGNYDLNNGLGTPGTSLGTIVVTVYESDGTTALPDTTYDPPVFNVPEGQPSGPWEITVTHDSNYTGAVIKAVLTPSGGTSQTATVTGIDITTA